MPEDVPRVVLVIEDNRDEADTLREIFEMAGAVAEVAYSGADGLEKAARLNPDVIVCDLGLPDVNGLEVARRLRADSAPKRAYLVALTGHVRPEDVELSAAAGYDQHMAKPADPGQLRRLVLHPPKGHAGA